MRRILSNIILVICSVVFCLCAYKLYGYFTEYKKAGDEYKEIKTEVVKKDKKGRRKIDFEKLKKMNPDVIGWIDAKGTGIDYPIVLGEDNDYYLHHTIHGMYNSSGAIFMDYHGTPDFSSEHTIIYGHHMKNGSMFANLLKYRESKFLKKHDVINLYTPHETIKLRVIAAYAKEANEKIPISFGDDYTITDYKKDIQARSDVASRVDETDIQKAKQVFTLVTCSYEGKDTRTFVHCIRVN